MQKHLPTLTGQRPWVRGPGSGPGCLLGIIHLCSPHQAQEASQVNLQGPTTDAQKCSAYNYSLRARLPLVTAPANGVQERWEQLSAAIHTSAADIVGYARSRRRPWITDETLEAVDQKAAARLAKDTKEWRRSSSVVGAKTKAKNERYFNQRSRGGPEQQGRIYSQGHQANLREGPSKLAVSNQQG